MDLTRPYAVTYVLHDKVENIFVQIICDNGLYGLGAGSPSEYVTGEILDHDFDSKGDLISDILVGREITEYRALIDILSTKLSNQPALVAALDMALHDSFCKSINISLLKFLGQKTKPLPTSITIGLKNLAETLEEGREYLDNGFKIIKLKIGREIDEDIERFLKLRELVKNKMLIRVDANQGFNVEEFLRFAEETKDYEVEFFEQPFKPDHYHWMSRLPEDLRRLCAADEDMHNLQDAINLAGSELVYGIFNIKLMKCGGISEALRIADIANATNKKLMWGCMDESVISISAALNSAMSCASTRYLDLDGSLDLASDIAEGGFKLKEGILYPLIDQPGLGVTLI